MADQNRDDDHMKGTIDAAKDLGAGDLPGETARLTAQAAAKVPFAVSCGVRDTEKAVSLVGTTDAYFKLGARRPSLVGGPPFPPTPPPGPPSTRTASRNS